MNNSYVEQREEILHSIERDEQELREAVDDLKDAALSWFSVRRHLEDHPWMLLGGAFAVGMWLGFRRHDVIATLPPPR